MAAGFLAIRPRPRPRAAVGLQLGAPASRGLTGHPGSGPLVTPACPSSGTRQPSTVPPGAQGPTGFWEAPAAANTFLWAVPVD